jgi:hypothetical protein
MTFNTASDILDLTSLMNFAKAFDKVLHQRLLYKLKFYGIKNETLNWISAFLSNVHKQWFWMKSHQILLQSLLMSHREQFWVLFVFW